MNLYNLKFRYSLIAFFSIILISCTSDYVDEPESEVVQMEDDDIPPITTIEFPDKEGLEVLAGEKVFDGFILVNDAAANRVYLMDKATTLIHEWNLNGKRLGNDAFLLDDGRLLAMLESETPLLTLGGFGGLISLIRKNGEVEWSYEYSNENHIAHHDAKMLPNGNILFLSWEKKSAEEANEIAFSPGTQIIYDAVLEINPTTNEIVWEWHMWDHLIQDLDDTKLNFGDVSLNPQLIDINYQEVTNPDGDVSHANGIDYDAENDLIYVSANFYSEIWVIDHSTTSEEAKSNSGGTFNKGGDLVYRFGNPSAYKNDVGLRLFDRNHHPNLLSGDKKGNILVYANGFEAEQSTAYELKTPETFELIPNSNNEPEIIWSFTDLELYSGRVSGVDILPNGNRLITEGDFGFWEVTEAGEIIWRYTEVGFFWRGYHFSKDSEAINRLQLEF
ncbi:aryl-sulfate sulfotransferase [Croceitalea sp. P059]|uniref:aryl-sulfate sulfotransferase n=1 Tax=Croceitalea sp. P059 TaxID=3075601 RepID=UPI002884B963|nr:aryl-sulfate sulfotransferase [Croceitalea sp. P059]MDT0540549.1 aryl-sulfate sulfotransferase [Croceitalea sp. P059]